ncbi:MAG: LacI family DNA-binding transcriptional regulator [Phycisphaera sp.]|nr:LacI family DNA-binding transcriptional regulator [Phycisphaera sp.]
MVATLKDIAKKTGLSIPSVSLILNGQGHKFRRESCRAVLDAARELKYRPDMVMRRLGRASTRRDAIGLLVQSESTHDVTDQPVHEYMCGVNDELLEPDQLLVVLKLNSLMSRNGHKPPRLLSERFVDGLILVETGLPESLQGLISDFDIMSVNLNTQKREDFDCVFADDAHSGALATQHLIELGHKRILFLPAPLKQSDGSIKPRYSSYQREHGYVSAMKAKGLVPECTELSAGLDDHIHTLIERIVASHSNHAPITGIVAGSMGLAIKTIEMLNLTPLRCPRDVSVMSAGDLRLFHTAWPHVSRITCDRYVMGRWAARMLLSKIQGEGRPQPSLEYKGELIRGGTTAPRLSN